MSQKNDAVSGALGCLGMVASNPLQKWIIPQFIFFEITCFSYVFCCLNLFRSDLDTNLLAKIVESQCVFILALTRFIMVWFHRSDITELLLLSKRFWILSPLGAFRQEEYSRMRKFSSMLFRTFYTISFTAASITAITAIFARDMPFEIYIPQGDYINYNTLYPLQLVVLYVFQHINIGFDSLFMGICINLTEELKTFRNILERIKFNDDDQLRDCFHHHIFLIRYVKKLQDTYSGFFLLQLFITTACFCMESYSILDANFIFAQIMRKAGVAIAVICELLFYCVPATNVSYQCSQIAQGIYNSNWYEKPKINKHMRYYIINMMRISQNSPNFTAAGLIIINMSTLNDVFKACVSLLTMVTSLQKK